MKAVVPISACMKNLEALLNSAHADLEQELYFNCNIAKKFFVLENILAV